MKKIFYIYFVFDLFVIILSSYMGGNWLINTQLAFISSILIIFSSFFAYKRMVDSNLQSGNIPEDTELLDKILDPYELDDEKEEKSSVSKLKDTISNTNKTKTGYFSPFRIFSYLVLILAFFVLNSQEIFNPIAFLVGISIMPFSALFFTILSEEKNR